MKKRSLYILRSVKEDISRLLAIVVIVFLGIGFLLGLLQSGPDLHLTADKYFKEEKLADITLTTSTGLDRSSSLELLEELDGITSYKLELESEKVLRHDGSNIYVGLREQEFLSDGTERLELLEGRYPTKKNECLALYDSSDITKLEIGSKIYDGETEFVVVGLARHVAYFSKQKIISISSSRTLNQVLFFNHNLQGGGDIFSHLSLTIDYEVSSFSKEYENLIASTIKRIEKTIDDSGFLKKNYQSIILPSVKEGLVANLILEGYSREMADAYLASDAGQNLLASTLNSHYETAIEQNDLSFYALDRNSNISFNILKSDIDKVITIANIFPVFFFLIAVLVASASISRLVKKDRRLAGTFKALGYENKSIISKYIYYGIGAILLGALPGYLVGIFLLPYIIHFMYCTIYYLPPIVFGCNPFYAILVGGAILLSVFAVIVFDSLKELKENSASLILDKVPKPGKKILLERIPPIWKRIPFRFKSMFRNVFRFKKNFLMMLLGVGGCTALLLTGFGVYDSLGALTKTQYQEIYNYNYIALTDNDLVDTFDRQDKIYYINGASINKESAYHFNILCSDELESYISFDKDFNSDSVVLTKQLASYFNIAIDEEFIFSVDGNEYTFTLTATTTNHVGNFLYLGANHLNTINSEGKYNAYIAYKDMTGINETDFIHDLISNKGVLEVVDISQSLDLYDKMLGNMIYIVLLIIVVSGILLVTVSYNLIDINISERRKEVATLKVLGYQKGEVTLYLFREVFFMTIIGIAIGLLSGTFLHHFAIIALQSPGLVFGLSINWLSYLLTIILTITFAILVTLFLGRKINKINMVESLKSVD